MQDRINPYLIGEKKLHHSYCLFLDILGVTQEIIFNERNSTSDDHFNRLYKVFVDASKALRHESDDDVKYYSTILYQCKLFTDNIVIGCPLDVFPQLDHEDTFGYIIKDIIQAQLKLVLNGYFIRGGWSFGSLYMDENMIYGEALIDAYKHEKDAVFPRIILSERVNYFVDAQLKYYAEPFIAPHYSHLLKDENGVLFINYLYDLVINEDGYQHVFKDELMIHKKLILDNIQNYKEDEKIQAKYNWAADYHNFFCKEFIVKYDSELIIEKAIDYKIERIINVY